MKQQNINQKQHSVRTNQYDAQRAFERIEAKLMKLDEKDIVRVFTDATRAAAIVAAAVPRIRAYEEELKAMPDFDAGAIDALHDLALATWYAQVLPDKAEANALPALVEEATQLKRKLLVHADSLAMSGVLEQARVDEIRAGRGHRDLAQDMTKLNALYSVAWDAIKERQMVTEKEVKRAGALGVSLMEALGEHDLPARPSTEVSAAELRSRTFSLLAKTYGEVQSALRYLRRNEGDWEEIAPTMFVRDRVVRKKSEAPPATPVAPVPPAIPPNG
jgi:hypothetical protein